ncbi:MAG: hypothetical protein A4E30_00308 [Methanomassiliicoccales archaeon PtaB.Bin215]|nr:MAG: hypothetical protein A4E30_00308 [Methanomassiliicoccales archaeon PtaB.Bin215]
MRLGMFGRTFDYKDVLNAINGPAKPTEWQLIRVMQHASYLEVAEDGRMRKLTKYRLNNMTGKETTEEDMLDDETSDMLSTLTLEEPRLCSITVSFNGSAAVIDQSLDITIRGDRDNARIAFLFMFPETLNEDGSVSYGVNKDVLMEMSASYSETVGYTSEVVQEPYRVSMRATHDLKDCGHLINAIRLNGGVRYFDRGGERK